MEQVKLPPEIKEKWLEALRGDEYVQVGGTLYDEEKSARVGKPACCCLGVLEHICGTKLEDMITLNFSSDLTTPRAPKEFLNGETSNDPAYLLANMNDGNSYSNVKKHSFAEIADYIEENY